MQAAIPESSPQKAGRRVLGEKTANASLTPATKRVADANSQKFQSTAIPFNALSKKTSSSSKTREFSSDARHAGQKRSIDQVVEDIKEAESEPRKLLMTSQTEEEAEFDIFNDENGTESRQPKALEATTSQQTDEGKARENMATNPEKSKDGSLSRVPTEPAARKVFIQQRAALARSRLQSAMRRVEDKSLDRALSQFEANSRPFLRTLSSSSSASSSRQQQPQQQQISQNSSPTKQKRVLLPPLPLQPRSRPVRSSAQTTAPSPSSGSLSIVSLPETDDEAEPIDSNDDDENDKTPKQSDFKQQDNVAESHGVGVSVSQESDSVMDKLVKWTQSSTDSIPTVEA